MSNIQWTDHIVIGGDFNSRVGPIPGVVGSLGKQRANGMDKNSYNLCSFNKIK